MDSSYNSHRSARGGTPDVLPASQYLQDRLQERRERNMRPKRARHTDFGPRTGTDDDIFLDEAKQSSRSVSRAQGSSPIPTGSINGSDAGTGGSGRRRALGLRDMNEQMDRLTKQNFALKLELDHRREHTSKLQEQLNGMREQAGRAEQLEEEHAELLKINSQLVDELEKRDKAVEEAMDLICELEDKMADMGDRNSTTRPSTANADSGYAGTETHEQASQSSPPAIRPAIPATPTPNRSHPSPSTTAASGKLFDAVNGQTPARSRREPNALSVKRPSTNALRKVYMENAQSLQSVKSFNSLLSKREGKDEDDEGALDSPRLSVLSESSFPSLYSPKKADSPERFPWEGKNEGSDAHKEGHLHYQEDSIKRVNQWIDARERSEGTPSKSKMLTAPLHHPERQPLPSSPKQSVEPSQPLGDKLRSPQSNQQKEKPELLQAAAYVKPRKPAPKSQPAKNKDLPSSIGGPIFGEPMLPPTPDSASTHMLRSPRSSMGEEKSLLDTTPAPMKGHDALAPAPRSVPRPPVSANRFAPLQQQKSQEEDDDEEDEGDETASEEDEDSSDETDSDDDADSETARDINRNYHGFPDGNSLVGGTPSRFLKHTRPQVTNMLFDGNDASPPRAAAPQPQRRQSSSEVTASPRKPSIARADTSPTIVRTQEKPAPRNPDASLTSVASPVSITSGTSSNRTILQTDVPTDSRRAPSIASAQNSTTSPSFTQRTQSLFRRMSNHGGGKEPPPAQPNIQREKSPLPTLTRTPSAAYIEPAPPREPRRPSNSRQNSGFGTPRSATGASTPASAPRRGPSNSGASTPAYSTPAPSILPVEREKVSRNPFHRTSSAQKASATPPPPASMSSKAVAATRRAEEAESSKREKEAGVRRKGSLRDTVGGKKPWRL